MTYQSHICNIYSSHHMQSCVILRLVERCVHLKEVLVIYLFLLLCVIIVC